MTDQELKLNKLLLDYGRPRNIAILNEILTFELIAPKFKESLSGLLELQKMILKHFPEYTNIEKVVNNSTYYWTILSKNK